MAYNIIGYSFRGDAVETGFYDDLNDAIEDMESSTGINIATCMAVDERNKLVFDFSKTTLKKFDAHVLQTATYLAHKGGGGTYRVKVGFRKFDSDDLYENNPTLDLTNGHTVHWNNDGWEVEGLSTTLQFGHSTETK